MHKTYEIKDKGFPNEFPEIDEQKIEREAESFGNNFLVILSFFLQ